MQVRNSLVLAGAVFLFQQTTPPGLGFRNGETVKPTRSSTRRSRSIWVESAFDFGNGSLIEIAYLQALQTRVRALKLEGKTLDQAADTASAEFRAKYPDWTGNAGAAARSAYNEAK
jgi:hypothetical protein